MRTVVKFLVAALMIGSISASLADASGTYYRWRDDKGKLVVSDRPPTDIGVTYVVKAFITVIGGGAVALDGTGAASALFGTVNQAVTFLSRPVVGEVALLIVAIVLLRLLPLGITGRYFRRSL